MNVLGILGAVSVPTSVVGLSQGLSNNKNEEQTPRTPQSDPRLDKFNIEVLCAVKSSHTKKINKKQVVLQNNKFYLDNPRHRRLPSAHQFSGFFIHYPAENGNPAIPGLVSTICSEPPILNWIYIDRNTLELKYGSKSQSMGHYLGPWDWTDDRVGLLFDGWEGFVAVEQQDGLWIVCFDRNEDHLEGIRCRNQKVLDCSLERRVVKPA